MADIGGFQDFVQARLATRRDEFGKAIRALVGARFPEPTARIHLEVYPENLHQGLPVVLFFLDAKGHEFPLDPGSFPLDPDLMDAEAILPENYADSWSTRCPGADLYTEAAQIFLVWLSELWKEAGGDNSLVGATIALHDDPRMFDLKRREWRPYDAFDYS